MDKQGIIIPPPPPPQWIPRLEGIKEIVAVLSDSLIPETSKQREVYERMEQLSKSEEFSNYLVTILTMDLHVATEVRQVAGISLKVQLEMNFNIIRPEYLHYIKEKLLQALYDNSPIIRKNTGNIISAFIRKAGLAQWSNILTFLHENLSMNDPQLVESGIECLSNIIEDSQGLFENESIRHHFLNFYPKLLHLMQATEITPVARTLAIYTCSLLLPILTSVDSLLPAVLKLSVDTNSTSSIRQKSCQMLACIWEISNDLLLPHFNNIADAVIRNMQETDITVSLSACEFWPLYINTKLAEDKWAILRPYLPRLLPTLLQCMRYGEADLMSMIPETEADLKHQFREDRMKELGGPTTLNSKTDDATDTGNVTLRKCAAFTLDQLSKIYKNETFVVLKQPIDQCLDHSQPWDIRESAILALGAIAQGSMEAMRSHIELLIRFLFSELEDEQPLLRSISCWTLSRFTDWILDNDSLQNNLVKTYLGELLKRLLDSEANVQEAACTALSTYLEKGGSKLHPYIFDAINVITIVLDQYKGSSLYNLLDTIGALAESLNENLRIEHIRAKLLPPLILKWNQFGDTDRALCLLFETFESIINGMGPYFEAYAPPVIDRALLLIDSTMNMMEDPLQADKADKEFLIRSIDILTAVSDAIGVKMEALLSKTGIVNTIHRAMSQKDGQVRQYTFAFFGDIAKNSRTLFEPSLQTFIPILIKNLVYFSPDSPEFSIQQLSVCNNSCWCLGELTMAYPHIMPNYVSHILIALVSILQLEKLNKSLAQNVSLTIGRFSLVAPQEVAPYLNNFLKQFCLSLRYISDGDIKKQAFQGICQIIPINPQGVLTQLPYFCDAIAQYKDPIGELENQFKNILQCFKQLIGLDWQSYYWRFPHELRESLTKRFAL